MDWQVIVTMGVVLGLLITLIKDWAPADLTFLGATGILAALGIISPSEAFSGFSNSGMLTVGMLFVVSAGLRETGVLDRLGHYVLGKAKTERSAMIRLSAVVLPMSAFLNNTPIVAMFMPVVIDWCRRARVSPSKLLIPLSYFAILGGTITLIGTSTNLVVNGLMIEAGMKGMGLFELAWAGVPYAIVGVGMLVFAGHWLLPARKELLEQLGEARREYLVEMRIDAGCRLIGQTVEVAGLRHLPGLFLVEIDRQGETLSPVSPDDVLASGDRLTFTGIVSSIMELERIPGLVPAVDPAYDITAKGQRQRQWCEAVISETSPLIGKSIREADFRETYGAAVLAVHRGGKRIVGKIGDIRLRPGDTLLLQVGRNFLKRHRFDPAFYLVSDVENSRPLRTDRAWIAVGLFALLLIAMTVGFMDSLVAAVVIAVAMIGTGCLSTSEARSSVEWQVLIAIGASFGVGKAIDNSGAAAVVAQQLVAITQGLGPIAALIAIYLITMIVTEIITNNAAAVLIFPFCIETANIYEVDSRPFLVALTLAASASFMTPIGYQTNMMVYGPGGYRFGDFIRAGLPLSLILWIVASIVIPIAWPLNPVSPPMEPNPAATSSLEDDLPVGAPIDDWKPALVPVRESMVGNWTELQPLSATTHAAALHRANSQDPSGRMWTYLGYGPFASPETYTEWVQSVEPSTDPLFFAVIDRSTSVPIGVASYLRIEPKTGVIEIGHLAYSPLLQRTRTATETAMLLIERAWEWGYRRIEWKCDSLNAASRRAAVRLGFQYEGLFRQATIVKGRNRDTAWYSILDADRPVLSKIWNEWRAPENFDAQGKQLRALSQLTGARAAVAVV